MATRASFKDQQAIASTLAPFVDSRSFVKYHEAFDSDLDKKQLMKYSGMLRALQKLARNLAFCKIPMRNALLSLAESKGFHFVSPAERQPWAQIQGLRIRVMCRHLQQAWLKARGSSSTWVRMLMTSPPPTRASSSTNLEEPRANKKHLLTTPPCIHNQHVRQIDGCFC